MKKFVVLISYVVSLCLTIHFCLLVKDTAVNLPIWDDFDSALYFANRYVDSGSLSEKLSLVLEQHNEHRIVINRVLTLLSMTLFSSVNFCFLIYCAIACLLALTALFAAKTREPWLALILSCAIMLQPQYGDGLNWVTTCLASFALCLLALVCSHLAFTPGKLFLWTFPLMALAGFSQGNGILLPLCITGSLCLQRQWKRALAVFLAGIAIIALYFQNYQFPAQSKKLSELFENYPAILEYGFTLIGNALGFSQPTASLISGVIVTLTFAAFLFTPAARKHPALVSFACFLFLSAAINTAARGLSGSQYALSPGRYTILCVGILTVLAIFALESIRHGALKTGLLAAALIFNYYSWQEYRSSVEELRIRAINDLALYLIFGNQGLTYPWPDRGVPIFEQSLAKGTYSANSDIKEIVDQLHLAQRENVPPLTFSSPRKNIRAHIDRAQMGREYIVIEGWGFLRACPSADTHTYLRLFTENSEVVIRPLAKKRGDLLGLFKNADRQMAGYITMFPKSYLNDGGAYRLEVLYSCGDLSTRQETAISISRSQITKVEQKPVPQEN